MGFTIYNDTGAGVNAAPLSEPQARPDKVDIDILAAGFNGSNVLSGCAVTPHSSGASLNIDVAAGTVYIGGTKTAVSAQANKTIAAADATNPRRDLISVNSSGTVVVTTGTAAATPCLPAIPATSVVIAVVDVPAAATSITANNITDKRVIIPRFGIPCVQATGSANGTAYTRSSTTMAAVDATNLAPTIAAIAGDVLEATFCATFVGSAGYGKTGVGFGPSATQRGHTVYVSQDGNSHSLSITVQYVVVSGDISGGSVAVTALFGGDGSDTATISNDSGGNDRVAMLTVKNLGQ